MDFIKGLPPSQGYSVLCVVIDILPKYLHFSPIKAYYANKQVAESFMKMVVKLHRIQTIVFDQDQVFTFNYYNLEQLTV